MTDIRKVQVSYGPEGRRLSLSPADDTAADSAAGTSPAGVLRIGDGCVTLELPTADGGTSMLAWDPAEVGLVDLGLPAAS